MRKEYIMTEDDKREKRKKIEKNRAIKKRSVKDIKGCTPIEPKQKNRRTEKYEDELDDDEEEDEDAKKLPNSKPVKINLLNMASASKKTYQKKQAKCNSNAEQLIPFPSPSLPESSPETVAVTESRTCNVFDEMSIPTDSSRSRSVEIYQISKSKEGKKSVDVESTNFSDSNIIKIILDSEFSKPSEVYTNSTVSRRAEDAKTCNYKHKLQTSGDYVISESDILELAKSNKNLLLESYEDGKQFLVISRNTVKDFVMRNGDEKLNQKFDFPKTSKKVWQQKDLENGGDSPLLSSLMESRKSSNGVRSPPAKNNAEEILQDIPR